jgi:hypothetical protein
MLKHLLPCAYKSLFGIDCPICGFQRALILLFNGDIKKSFLIYPPLLPAVFLIMIFALHLLNTKLVNRKFLINYSSFVLTIITVNYFIKLTM